MGEIASPIFGQNFAGEERQLSPPLVLPLPSLAPWGASVVTLATDDKRCPEKLVNLLNTVQCAYYVVIAGRVYSLIRFLSETKVAGEGVTPDRIPA